MDMKPLEEREVTTRVLPAKPGVLEGLGWVPPPWSASRGSGAGLTRVQGSKVMRPS